MSRSWVVGVLVALAGIASAEPDASTQAGSGSGEPSTRPASGHAIRLPNISPPEFVTLGTPTVKGKLPVATVRRAMKRNLNKIRYCYEKAVYPLPKGTLKLSVAKAKYTIDEHGKVTSAALTGMKDQDVTTCVTAILLKIEHPEPTNGKPVTVVYPMTFKPD